VAVSIIVMRLLEAIIDANHRALAGDANAGLHPADFANELPLAALTCIDARLNPLFPAVLGLPPDKFIWLRNAGNIITGPLSSTMRSLALACAVKGAREIAIIGHTDCLVCKTSSSKLVDAFAALGVRRDALPANINEYFGLFASERQNVVTATGIVRGSPLIGPKIPVHGLLVDINTGKLDWIVNGYQVLDVATPPAPQSLAGLVGAEMGALKSFAEYRLGEMKFPDSKLGDVATQARDWAIKEVGKMQPPTPAPAPQAPPPLHIAPTPPPKIPLPPPIRPVPVVKKFGR
jgi:carbonic anhydrase